MQERHDTTYQFPHSALYRILIARRPRALRFSGRVRNANLTVAILLLLAADLAGLGLLPMLLQPICTVGIELARWLAHALERRVARLTFSLTDAQDTLRRAEAAIAMRIDAEAEVRETIRSQTLSLAETLSISGALSSHRWVHQLLRRLPFLDRLRRLGWLSLAGSDYLGLADTTALETMRNISRRSVAERTRFYLGGRPSVR
jgi:hypothetical protein